MCMSARTLHLVRKYANCVFQNLWKHGQSALELLNILVIPQLHKELPYYSLHRVYGHCIAARFL